MRIKIAEQIAETPQQTIIQRTYKLNDRYQTITEVWKPKVSWFSPPTIRIFKWAYKIETEVSERALIILDDESDPVFVNQKSSGDGITQIGIQIIKGGKDEC